MAERTPTLILITGLPAAGKTTLSRHLATALALPLVARDALKEVLFDSLGVKDREWSRKLGHASYGLVYAMTESLLKAKTSFILEANFKAEVDNSKFKQLQQRYPFHVFQILCYADGQVLIERFKQRALSGERHPGHVDTSNFAEMEPLLRQGRCEPLDIGGELLEIDTTNFENVQVKDIITSIQRFQKERLRNL